MASVSETLVREFFELHGFLVRQPRKYSPRSPREPEEADLLVVNPRAQATADPLPLLLEVEHLPRVARALVVVKGWHTETFSPTRLAQMPEIFRFANASVVRQAARELGEGPPLLSILVVPSLPQSDELRQQSLKVIREKGVDMAISFPTLLDDLLRRVEINRDYLKSEVLQLLRILKNYGFLRDSQLELFKPPRRRRSNLKSSGG
jgi:hypothetical protein